MRNLGPLVLECPECHATMAFNPDAPGLSCLGTFQHFSGCKATAASWNFIIRRAAPAAPAMIEPMIDPGPVTREEADRQRRFRMTGPTYGFFADDPAESST